MAKWLCTETDLSFQVRKSASLDAESTGRYNKMINALDTLFTCAKQLHEANFDPWTEEFRVHLKHELECNVAEAARAYTREWNRYNRAHRAASRQHKAVAELQAKKDAEAKAKAA